MVDIKNAIIKYKQSTDKKKIENAIYLLIMLVVVVIGINMIFKEDKTEDTELKKDLVDKLDANISKSIDNENLEKRLEQILNKVKGVNNVSVLITYKSKGKNVPMYNTEQIEKTTIEEDSNGGNRSIIEKTHNEEIVFQESGSNKSITNQIEYAPEISGIIVVANFNNNAALKQQITSAVSAVTGVSEYKVQVLSGGYDD